jgi:hypothetical protein
VSTFTALILCTGAMLIGFIAASCLAASSSGDLVAETWQEGREYGHAEAEAARDRAVTLRPVATMKICTCSRGDGTLFAGTASVCPVHHFAPYDWERNLADAAERNIAKSNHPSNWVEGHADRGPWPA